MSKKLLIYKTINRKFKRFFVNLFLVAHHQGKCLMNGLTQKLVYRVMNSLVDH